MRQIAPDTNGVETLWHEDVPESVATFPTGEIWDALAIAVGLHSSTSPNVLVLGYGGGTIGAGIRSYLPEATITGVDPCGIAWQACKKWGNEPNIKAHADALTYLHTAIKRRNRFDVVVEDVFDCFKKPSWVLDLGYVFMREILGANGILISNHSTAVSARAAKLQLLNLFPGPDGVVQGRVLGNHMLVARHQPIEIWQLNNLMYDTSNFGLLAEQCLWTRARLKKKKSSAKK